MISIFHFSIGLVALLGAHILKPRIPHYIIQVQSVFPTYIQPKSTKGSKRTNDKSQQSEPSSITAFELSADIKMFNDNFIPIGIHSLTFDVFYPDWNDELRHIGQVTDQGQYTTPQSGWWSSGSQNDHQKKTTNSSPSTYTSNVTTTAITTETSSSSSSPSTWKLLPRSHFHIVDNMYMTPYGELGTYLSFAWDMMMSTTTSQNHIQLPLTGVLHISADNLLPLTLSIVCNNQLDVWTLTVEGLQCDLDNLSPGWKRMDTESQRLRSKLNGMKWRRPDQKQQTIT